MVDYRIPGYGAQHEWDYPPADVDPYMDVPVPGNLYTDFDPDPLSASSPPAPSGLSTRARVGQTASGLFTGPNSFGSMMYETARALPGVMYDAADLPAAALRGEGVFSATPGAPIDPLSDVGIGRAADAAGTVTLGGGAVPRAAPRNSLRAGYARPTNPDMEHVTSAAIYGPDGNIYAGRMHYEIGETLPPDVADKFWSDYNPSREGFLTSLGRFVTREEADEIARASGQIDDTLTGQRSLSSEDLMSHNWGTDEDDMLSANRDRTAGAVPLAMDRESRMRRAAESYPELGYHGTTSDISAFDRPTWITDDPNVAGYYSDRAALRDAMDRKEWDYMEERPDIDEVDPRFVGDLDVGELEGQNIMPLRYNPGRNLDMTELGDAPDLRELTDWLHEKGIIKEAVSDEDLMDWEAEIFMGEEGGQPTLWKMIEDLDLGRDIKQAGYDSLSIEDVVSTRIGNQGHRSTMIIDPAGKIRSTAAAFDPAKSDSADILAANRSITGAIPLFSRMEREAAAIPQPKAQGQQWSATLKNRGVPAEEIEWTGIADWLKERGTLPVTKEELLAEIGRRQTQVGVSKKSSSATQEEVNAGVTYPKYSTYQLPGGENYREVLYTLDNLDYKDPHWDEPGVVAWDRRTDRYINDPSIPEGYTVRNKTSGNQGPRFDTPEEAQEYLERLPEYLRDQVAVTPVGARPSHTGQRVLFVEEIQSGLHQRGRREGYKLTEAQEEKIRAEQQAYWDKMYDEGRITEDSETGGLVIPADVAARLDEFNSRLGSDNSVPGAPFKKTWPDLVLRRLVADAVEGGYDAIAWTNGATQADRYNLAKQIKLIHWNPRTETLIAYPTDRVGPAGSVISEHGVTAEKLPDFIGKEAADRLINNPTQIEEIGHGDTRHVLSGVDLQVGGEGMKAFYDVELPRRAKKLFGKWGAVVEDSNLPGSSAKFNPEFRDALQRLNKKRETGRISEAEYEIELKALHEKYPQSESGPQIHILRITPEMRAAVQSEGLPLFANRSKAGALTLTPTQERALTQWSMKLDVTPELENLISTSTLPRDRVLWRGAPETRLTNLSPGQVIEAKNLVASSRDKSIAESYTLGSGFEKTAPQIMKIRAPAGTTALEIPEYYNEFGDKEVLFPRGTKFRVISQKGQVIELESVGPDTPAGQSLVFTNRSKAAGVLPMTNEDLARLRWIQKKYKDNSQITLDKKKGVITQRFAVAGREAEENTGPSKKYRRVGDNVEVTTEIWDEGVDPRYLKQGMEVRGYFKKITQQFPSFDEAFRWIPEGHHRSYGFSDFDLFEWMKDRPKPKLRIIKPEDEPSANRSKAAGAATVLPKEFEDLVQDHKARGVEGIPEENPIPRAPPESNPLSVLTPMRSEVFDSPSVNAPIVELPVDQIKTWQATAEPAKIRELSENYPPIHVGRVNGELVVFNGNHRLLSAMYSGSPTIRAKFVDFDDPRFKKYWKRGKRPITGGRFADGGAVSVKVNGQTYTGPKKSFRGRPLSKNIDDRRGSQWAKVDRTRKGDRLPSALESLVAPESIGMTHPHPEPDGDEMRTDATITEGIPPTIEELILRQGGDQFTSGLVEDPTPGRTDRLPTSMPADSYVIPADIVSGMGQGNTLAGAKILDAIFKAHDGPATRRAEGGATPAAARVPVIVAGGEYIVPPDRVRSVGGGDAAKGHKLLDSFTRRHRVNLVRRLKTLPGPRRD